MTTKPWVLGLASSHNGGACLLHGNEIVVAIQEERLLRVKRAQHPGAFPSLAIQYCLDSAHIQPSELDAIVLCASSQARRPEEDVRLNPQVMANRHGVALYTIPHHLGHAISAYAMSGCPEESAVMVIDGRGSPWDELTEDEQAVVPPGQLARETAANREMPREHISTYRFNDGHYVPLEKHVSSYELSQVSLPGFIPFASLGDMYGAVGEQIFGSQLDGPGKVMALAPFGLPRIPVHDFYHIVDGGFVFQSELRNRFDHDERWPKCREEYCALAASVQTALEEAILYVARNLRASVRCNHLCYAGGVALNSVANERLIAEGGFSNVFIMPAAEDSGTAIGAAFYGLWQLVGYSRHPKQEVDSVGHSYSPPEIEASIRLFPEVIVKKPDDLITSVCELLQQGKIVGWYEGGAELGPRALGQRSILADPRRASAKDHINGNVKFREPFRPFAPMILEEEMSRWFDVDERDGASPFMLRVMRFRPDKAKEVPAVVHDDGTGRVQTITKWSSPKLHTLLTRWKEMTGVPILLNTSFNVAGEPIVETPRDALLCLCTTGVDWCNLGGQLVTKGAQAEIADDCLIRFNALWYGLFDAEGKPTVDPAITAGQDVTMTPVSMHISRIAEMTISTNHVRLAVRTPWGVVVHALAANFMQILKCIDDLSPLSVILSRICDESVPSDSSISSVARCRSQLAVLRRIGVIDFIRTVDDPNLNVR